MIKIAQGGFNEKDNSCAGPLFVLGPDGRRPDRELVPSDRPDRRDLCQDRRGYKRAGGKRGHRPSVGHE